MMAEKDFLEDKKRALKKLEKAWSENKVDGRILPILNMINNSEEYYTSSSCSGRVVLLEIPQIGDKKRARFLGKWHRNITADEITSAVKKAKVGLLWLLAQSPILHIVANKNETADKMVKIANASGFKNSGLKSTGRRTVVEVCSTERLDAPIGRDGALFCDEEYLQLLVDIANEIMKRSILKLRRFEEKLKKCLSTHKTTQ